MLKSCMVMLLKKLILELNIFYLNPSADFMDEKWKYKNLLIFIIKVVFTALDVLVFILYKKKQAKPKRLK